MITRTFRHTLISSAGLGLISLASSHAAVIIQTNSQNNTADSWNATAAWNGAAPVLANDYESNATPTTGALAATATGLGTTVTSRVRNGASSTFGGNSLKIVTGTELLVRNAGTVNTGNIILDNGTIRSVSSVTFAGTLTTTTTATIGLGSTNILTINSNVTGNGTFQLRSSDGAPTIRFSGALLTAFSAFGGTLDLGGGPSVGAVTLDFNEDYYIPATLSMGAYSTLDVLNLDQAISVNSFKFGATTLAPDNYTAAELNSLFGNGAQFTGGGSLTVVPEPSALLLGSLGSLFFLRRRRSM
ncbi:MAG: hypothetical protein EOP88_01335 [Verrucomicrobiaceae bacterium]|nr:MAG: hypothetical protein EOP88_01335 [Verrucomicrobiaceae bacterium]